ncbi:MAG TPA: hypothetical protein VFD58_30330 [Blastocatellia bacterium]|nr:hypothetical protein [Blastocatellia bacterium]
MADTSSSKIARQQTVSGLFRDKASAERAWDALVDLGYSRDESSVVLSDETHNRYFRIENPADAEPGSKALESAGVGGAIGTAVGGLLGALAAIGTSIALPGLGIVIAGPIAAALAGAGAGGVTGGLIGALVGSGMPEERAKYYEEGIKGGGVLISVTPHTAAEAERIERVWQEYGGEVVSR